MRPVRWLSTGYIELFRSIPLLLLIYAFLLALPRFGINLPILWKLVVPIILVNVAVLAEVYRAGILSVDRGQFEAAAALGLPNGVAMRAVILPQAIRYVVPSLVTQLVALLKDSTLGYVVSYPELMKQATNLTSYTHLLVQTYLVVALIYVVVNLLLSRFAEWLERRMGRRGRTRAVDVDEAVGTPRGPPHHGLRPRADEREQQGLADVAARQHHDQPVDAHAEAAGRRHRVLQGDAGSPRRAPSPPGRRRRRAATAR